MSDLDRQYVFHLFTHVGSLIICDGHNQGVSVPFKPSPPSQYHPLTPSLTPPLPPSSHPPSLQPPDQFWNISHGSTWVESSTPRANSHHGSGPIYIPTSLNTFPFAIPDVHIRAIRIISGHYVPFHRNPNLHNQPQQRTHHHHTPTPPPPSTPPPQTHQPYPPSSTTRKLSVPSILHYLPMTGRDWIRFRDNWCWGSTLPWKRSSFSSKRTKSQSFTANSIRSILIIIGALGKCMGGWI